MKTSAFVLLVLLVQGTLLADWPCRPDTTVPVAVAAGNQWNVRMVSDRQNGAIMVWQDRREGNFDKIFIQRMSASGKPLWQQDGIQVATTDGFQYYPQAITDDAGGAFIIWQDNRSGVDYDVYAQHFDAGGNPLWTANGAVVCNATGNQYNPQLASDRVGGIIVTWQDRRSGSYDIYAQRLNSGGNSQWTATGVPVCGAANDQVEPKIVGDGSGGAYVAWLDYRAGNGSTDIYAHHFSSLGQTNWQADGIPVCNAANIQWNLQAATDGLAGLVLTWQDRRNGTTDNIFAQRIDPAAQIKWGFNGLQVAPSSGFQSNPQVTIDGAGLSVLTWQDNRSGSDYDIFAQRIDRAGQLQWTPGGKSVSGAPGQQYNPQLAAQGNSVFFTWQDRRGPDFDIYAQRFDLNGQPFWTLNGVQVAALPADQIIPQLSTDGLEGGVVAWADYHLGSGSTDLYAHRIGANGLPAGGCFRTFTQDSLSLKAVRFKTFRGIITGKPNPGNVRDSVFSRGAFPDGLLIGRERADSAKKYGWIFFTKSLYLKKAMPAWALARPLAKLLDRDFVGKLRNPSIARYNNALVGELLAFKLNIAASDVGLTPEGIGDLVYRDSTASGVLMSGRSLRGLTSLVDSVLTYYRSFSGVNYPYLASTLRTINKTFDGAFDTISTSPLRVKASKPLFAVWNLVPGVNPPTPVPAFQPVADDFELPAQISLSQNYPNPFNPFTTIEFQLPEPAVVTMKVYNSLGQEVATLFDQAMLDDGQQVLDFDASNLASGVYFYQLLAEPASGGSPLIQVKKMMVLK